MLCFDLLCALHCFDCFALVCIALKSLRGLHCFALPRCTLHCLHSFALLCFALLCFAFIADSEPIHYRPSEDVCALLNPTTSLSANRIHKLEHADMIVCRWNRFQMPALRERGVLYRSIADKAMQLWHCTRTKTCMKQRSFGNAQHRVGR